VGLRWWNEVKEDGSNEWIFESKENQTNIHASQKNLFWISLIVFTLFWLIVLISQLLTWGIKWVTLCGLAFALSVANMTGYIKCAKDAKEQAKKFATSLIISQI